MAGSAPLSQQHCTVWVHSAMQSDAAFSQLLLLLTSLCNGTCHRPHKYKLWVLEPFTCSLSVSRATPLAQPPLSHQLTLHHTDCAPKSPPAFSPAASVSPGSGVGLSRDGAAGAACLCAGGPVRLRQGAGLACLEVSRWGEVGSGARRGISPSK